MTTPRSHTVRRAAFNLKRIGLAARGVLYLLIGAIAALAGASLHAARGTKGALAFLTAFPGGRIFVAILGAGFAAFAVGELLLLFVEPRLDWKAWWRRLVALCLACTYASLAVLSLGIALDPDATGEGSTRDRIADLLALPAGRILLAAIAAGIGIFGILQLIFAITARLNPVLAARAWPIRALARLGAAGRGTLFLGMGMLLARGAFNNDPNDSGSIGATLHALQQHAAARPILIALGAALLAFGISQLLESALRERPTPPFTAGSASG